MTRRTLERARRVATAAAPAWGLSTTVRAPLGSSKSPASATTDTRRETAGAKVLARSLDRKGVGFDGQERWVCRAKSTVKFPEPTKSSPNGRCWLHCRCRRPTRYRKGPHSPRRAFGSLRGALARTRPRGRRAVPVSGRLTARGLPARAGLRAPSIQVSAPAHAPCSTRAASSPRTARQVAVPADLEHRSPLVAPVPRSPLPRPARARRGASAVGARIETRIEDQARRDALDDRLSALRYPIWGEPRPDDGETCASGYPIAVGAACTAIGGSSAPGGSRLKRADEGAANDGAVSFEVGTRREVHEGAPPQRSAHSTRLRPAQGKEDDPQQMTPRGFWRNRPRPRPPRRGPSEERYAHVGRRHAQHERCPPHPAQSNLISSCRVTQGTAAIFGAGLTEMAAPAGRAGNRI